MRGRVEFFLSYRIQKLRNYRMTHLKQKNKTKQNKTLPLDQHLIFN